MRLTIDSDELDWHQYDPPNNKINMQLGCKLIRAEDSVSPIYPGNGVTCIWSARVQSHLNHNSIHRPITKEGEKGG